MLHLQYSCDVGARVIFTLAFFVCDQVLRSMFLLLGRLWLFCGFAFIVLLRDAATAARANLVSHLSHLLSVWIVNNLLFRGIIPKVLFKYFNNCLITEEKIITPY
ncbi:MAG TPA: hypothetical protein ENI02_02405 [Candidatus Aminicenantes bacterium]|nr:hypothetical protein [Candidatus Aminicenantes bacterium]